MQPILVCECNTGFPTTLTFQVSVEEVVGTSLALGAAVEEVLTSPSIPTLEALQAEWLNKVHPNHYHLHAVKHSLLQLYARNQEKAEDGEKDDTHWQVGTQHLLSTPAWQLSPVTSATGVHCKQSLYTNILQL